MSYLCVPRLKPLGAGCPQTRPQRAPDSKARGWAATRLLSGIYGDAADRQRSPTFTYRLWLEDWTIQGRRSGDGYRVPVFPFGAETLKPEHSNGWNASTGRLYKPSHSVSGASPDPT